MVARRLRTCTVLRLVQCRCRRADPAAELRAGEADEERLLDTLLPHQRAEERALYPAAARRRGQAGRQRIDRERGALERTLALVDAVLAGR